MNGLRFLLVGLYFLGALCAKVALADGGLYEYSKGEIVKLNPSEFHPTQFIYSKLEVSSKVSQLKKIMAEKGVEGVERFLEDKRGEVVVGPSNKMWLIDGHHQARALEILRSSEPSFAKIKFEVEVRNEWNELSAKEFAAAMKAGNKKGKQGEESYVYLKDAKGKTRDFKQLPKKLSAMKDFPWRGLVWLLKQRDVIESAEHFLFQEFFLAEELRKKIPLPSRMTNRQYEQAFKKAVEVIENLGEDKRFGFEMVSQSECVKILRRFSE